MTSQPTLLVFTLGAVRERERRPLLPAEHRGAEVELRRACRRAAVRAGRQAGCRVVVSAPAGLRVEPDAELQVQEGRGFGERLERACRRAAAGGGPLIVVGTDVPGLRAGHLLQALAVLREGPDRVVLGPSPDGGFYLLAAARPIPGLGGLTRWCRRDTLRRLRRALERRGRSAVLLEPLRDLDHRRDLERWVARPPHREEALAKAARPAAPDGPPTAAPGAADRGCATVEGRASDGPSAATGGHCGEGRGRGGRAGDAVAAPPVDLPLFPAAVWRRLIRHLARLLAALRRLAPEVPAPALRPAALPVRVPRGPPPRRS